MSHTSRLLFTFLFFCLLAQATYPARADANDPSTTARIDSLISLMETTVCNQDSLTLVYYREIEGSLEGYPGGALKALEQLGKMKYCAGDLDSAIFYYRRAAQIGLTHNLSAESVKLLNRLGFYFQTAGLLDSSSFYLHKGLLLAQEVGDSLYIGSSYIGIGILHQHKGQIDKALDAYFQALRIAEKIDDKPLIITAKLNVATIYYDHQPDKLKSSDFLELLDLTRVIGDQLREMSVLEWLGYLKADSSEFEESVAYFNQGLKVNESVRDQNSAILLLQGISYAYNLAGDHEQSITTNNKIIELARSSGYELYLPSMYVNNVSNYLALGRYREAIQDGLLAVKAGKKSGQIELYHKVLQDMAVAYKQLNMPGKAYETQLEYSRLSKTILDAEKSRQLAEMQTKYETESKQSEIELLSREAAIQKLQLAKQEYFLAGLIILILVIIGGAVLIYRQRQLRQQQAITDLELEETKKRLVVEQQYRASELKALRSQMNPHFVFNALNSIQEYIMFNEKKLAGKYLGKFADLMRIYLNHSQARAISVAEEVEALNLYLELEKLRFEDALTYEVIMEEGTDNDQIKLPALLLQPYVENALKHGLLHKKTDRKLTVRFSYLEAEAVLRCEVIDNGVGRVNSAARNQSRDARHKPFATNAIKSRIELINYNSEKPVVEQIEDLYDDAGNAMGTHVMISVPKGAIVDLEV